MAKKETQEIIKLLSNYDYEDIAIAIIAIENNTETQSLSDKNYAVFKNAYRYYITERDDLTGILNEVLQNAINHNTIEN